MRNTQHSNIVQFRAGDLLVSELQQRTRASGVSVSEFLRSLVREKVGLQ